MDMVNLETAGMSSCTARCLSSGLKALWRLSVQELCQGTSALSIADSPILPINGGIQLQRHPASFLTQWEALSSLQLSSFQKWMSLFNLVIIVLFAIRVQVSQINKDITSGTRTLDVDNQITP